MMKRSILALCFSLPVVATELPPAIPDGPVTYDAVSYQSPAPADDSFLAPADYGYTAPAAAPVTPSVSAGDNGYININAYTSNYNVRGMGFTNALTDYGYSSVSGSYKLPHRDLFGRGIYQRVSGSYGIIWGAGDYLGDTCVAGVNYALGKEIFPNLTAEIGYSLHYGGFEGFMAKSFDDAAHRMSQDLNFTLCFNDRQRGFFGSMTWAWAFKGLNGVYGDVELGYRFTNVINGAVLGADLELSAGVATSFDYWAAGADGVDAYRIRAALPLFTHSGTMGRDARMQLTPWAQVSWSGENAAKIDRCTGGGPIDHSLITVGVDLGWRF